MADPFLPHRGPSNEARMRAIENYLAEQGASPNTINQAVAAGAQPGLDNTGRGAGAPAATGSPAPAASIIPEDLVEFDPDSGHAHDGISSHTIALAGDVTGTNTAAVVAKVNGKTAPTPAASDDKHFFRYDDGGSQYVLVAVPVLTNLGAWVKADVSALGGADAEITNAWASAAMPNPMPRAGTLVALGMRFSADLGGVGDSVTVTVYKNGVATALTSAQAGTAGADLGGVAEVTPVSFASGDVITVQAKKGGAPGAVALLVTVWGTLN